MRGNFLLCLQGHESLQDSPLEKRNGIVRRYIAYHLFTFKTFVAVIFDVFCVFMVNLVSVVSMVPTKLYSSQVIQAGSTVGAIGLQFEKLLIRTS